MLPGLGVALRGPHLPDLGLESRKRPTGEEVARVEGKRQLRDAVGLASCFRIVTAQLLKT